MVGRIAKEDQLHFTRWDQFRHSEFSKQFGNFRNHARATRLINTVLIPVNRNERRWSYQYQKTTLHNRERSNRPCIFCLAQVSKFGMLPPIFSNVKQIAKM